MGVFQSISEKFGPEIFRILSFISEFGSERDSPVLSNKIFATMSSL